MMHGLMATLRRQACLVRTRQLVAIVMACGLLALGACDPRGSASVDDLVKRAQEQRAAGNIRASIIELKNAVQKDGQNANTRLLLGQAFLDLGDVTSADIELRRAQELGAPAERVVPLIAETRILQGRSQQVLHDVVLSDADPAPMKATVLTLRGRAHLALGQRVQAEEAFKAALALDDKAVDALLGLARISAGTGKADAGRDYLSRAAGVAPNDPEVLTLQGDFALAAKDFGAAEDFFQKILKVRKDDRAALNAQLGIARAQISAGKLADATAGLSQIIKLAPKDPMTNYLRALAAYQSKDYELAKTHSEVALGVVPDHRPSLFLAGAANYALQQNETALRYLTQFVSQVPGSVEGRKMLAALQIRLGDPNKAVRTLQETKSDDAQLLSMVGVATAQAGDAVAAKNTFERVVAAEPEDSSARMRLGMTRLSLGETEEGLKDMEAASKLNPGSEADITLALAYFRTREFDKALEAAKRVQEHQPTRAIGYALAGVAYRAKQNPEEARKSFLKALEVEPGDRTALENLARIAIQERKFDAARGYFEEIAKRNPTDGRLQMTMAQLDLETGRGQESLKRLQDLVTSQPDFVPGHVALARAQLATGNASAAMATVQAAATRWPDNPDVTVTRGQIHLRLGQTNGAIAAFKDVVAQAPHIAGSYQLLAGAYQAAGDRAKALAEIEKAVAIAPSDPGLKLLRGQLLAETGRVDEAVKIAAELRAAFPQSPLVAEFDGALALAQQRPKDAVASFQQAMERSATTENVIRLASAQAAAGAADQSEQTLKGWLAKNPDDVRARIVLGDRYLARQRLADAEKEYAEILRHAPDAVIVLNNLAWVMAQQGRASEALPHARRAAELAPDSAPILDTLGTTQLQVGQTAEAVASLRKAIEKAPNVPSLEFHLAEALAKQGKQDEARTVLRKALGSNQQFSERDAAEKLLRELGS